MTLMAMAPLFLAPTAWATRNTIRKAKKHVVF